MPLAARPDRLDGRTIGLLWNAKPNGDVLLRRVQEQLEVAHLGARFVFRSKRMGALPMPEEVLHSLRDCDVVVNACGDSGSPTSWSVHDAITLEKTGVPTCTFVTAVFAAKGQREAQALGMGGLPMVVLPHPVGQLAKQEMERLVDERLDEVRSALTAA